MQLLQLSKNENKIFTQLKQGDSTPLELSRSTHITRPTVYETLKKLKARKLVQTKIVHGKKYWTLEDERVIEDELYKAKKALLDISETTEEVHGRCESNIIIYKDEKSIQKLLFNLLSHTKNERMYGIQGNNIEIGWSKIFSPDATNKLNRLVKKNKIIMEAVIPRGWFEKHAKLWGKEWVKHFMGRMTIAHEIDEEYFKHGAQLFATKNALYLLSFNESLAIEIRNSETQKLVLSLLSYIQDNAKRVEPNTILGKLVENVE